MGHLSLPRIVAYTVVVASLLACGAGSKRSGAVVHAVIHEPAPGAGAYSTQAATEPVVGPHREAVEAGVSEATQRHNITIHGDGRLGRLAFWTAAQLGEGYRAPPHAVVEFFARHLGLVEPVPHLLVIAQSDASSLQQGIAQTVAELIERQRYNHYGAAVSHQNGMIVTVIALSWRWVEIEPVPRKIKTGRVLRARGRLLGAYTRPRFAVARPNGRVERTAGGAGPGFDVEIPLASKGVHRIELLASGPGGDTVIANFPLYVDIEVPRRVQVETGEAPTARHAEGVRDALLDLINHARRRMGVRELDARDDLEAIAQAHSQDMVEHRFVGHTSPRTGSAVDRVHRAGFRPRLILENIGRGYSAEEIHRGLMESPGHRANILHPEATHVGVGVVAEAEGSRTAFVVTQVFTQFER